MYIDQFLEDDTTIVLISSDTCSVCGVIQKKVEELVNEDYPLVKIKVVKIDQHPILKGELMIFSVPAVLIYFDRKEIYRKAGYINMSEIEDMLDRIYG